MILEQRQHRVPDRGVVDARVHEEHRRAVSAGVLHPEPVVADRQHRVHPCTVERGSGGGEWVSWVGWTGVVPPRYAAEPAHPTMSTSWEARVRRGRRTA